MLSRYLRLLTLLVAAGCTAPQNAPDGPDIVVTIRPIALLLSEIAPQIDVAVLLPPGTSAHAFDPVPSTARMAASAGRVIAMHPEVDGWTAGLVDSPIWLTDALDEEDPHAWLDPAFASATLPILAAEVCGQVPHACPASATVAEAQARILASGRLAADRLAEYRIVASAPFLTALQRATGVAVIDVVSPVEGVEPSPAQLAASVRTAADAEAVVALASMPELAAEVVSDESGVQLILVEPMGLASDSVYSSFLDRFTRRIAGAVE